MNPDLPPRSLDAGSCILKEHTRIYAVAGKSWLLAGALAMITASQLSLGIYQTFLAATHPGGLRTLGGLIASLL